MSPRLLSGLLLCALLTPAVAAQSKFPPSISHSSWTATDGLPQVSVMGISQDTAGYVWISTFGGLARFDGRHFEAFDVLSRSDLPGNRFTNVLHGRDDSMWVWSPEYGLLRYVDDRFTRIETPHPLRQMTVDEEGCLWGTFPTGVARIFDDRVDLVREGDFYAILAAENGSIWVSASGGELSRIEDGQATVFGADAGIPPGELMRALLMDADGNLWGGSYGGVWRSTDATKTEFERVEGAPGRVQNMVQDERGAIWFSCGDRLVRWDPDTSTGIDVVRGRFAPLLKDTRGNLWSGGLEQGLHCLRYGALHDANALLDQPAANTWAITEDASGAVLILYDRQLCKVQDGESTVIDFDRDLKSLLVDRKGDLWIGMAGRLLRIRGNHETAYGEDAGLSGTVRSMLEDRDGGLWAGTGTGLYRREGDRFVPFFPEQLVGVRCLLEDEASDTLWIGTQTGLARIHGDVLTWLTVEDGLSPGVICALHLDPEGVLWAGSYGGGLSRIEEGIIVRYSRYNGLADNYISCILEDDDERLWINSNRGPFVVHRSELNRVATGEAVRVACTSFTRGEGAREANGGNQPAGWRAADGRMWFPSTEGVTVADPTELPLDEAPPSVLVKSLEIDSSRALDVRFTALGFSSPERVRIQTRLIGQNPSWIEDLGDRRAHYSYLPPGNYEFQVRARNGYGPWSQVLSERVSVEARFHETTAFLVGIALLGALGALSLTAFQLKRSRERTAELVQLVEERERAERSLRRSQIELRRLSRVLLHNQETQFRRISRELHDDLSQRLAALANEVEYTKRHLGDGIEQTRDQLSAIVGGTQQVAKDVQLLSRRLHPVGLRTLGLSEAVRQECDAFTRRGGVSIDREEDLASDELPEVVAVAAFRILQESLHNIEKHARASAVRVRIMVEDGELVVTVSDNGQGFALENSTDVGLGLVTMRERAASVAGEISVTSRPGDGTTVCLRVPEQRS